MKRVTIIKFEVNKRSSDGRGSFNVEGVFDTSTVTDMVIASSR